MKYLILVLLLGSTCYTMTPNSSGEWSECDEEGHKNLTIDPQDDQFCFLCDEEFPAEQGHFTYGPGYSICIHCYFYHIPRTVEPLGLTYISKRRKQE